MAFAPVRGPDPEKVFESSLINKMYQFQRYEDRAAQSAALAVLPLLDLTAIAQAKYDSCPGPANTTKETTAAEVRDLLLLELLTWFKSFFSWMDTPPCPLCGAERTTLRPAQVSPTYAELGQSASRVESYTCRHCAPGGGEVTRFPRINDPVALLSTRKGRCGEWANCFALICLAAGFEVRHVTDWTDHVWVEVFSCAQARWLHADPCENTCDNPLLYEAGWGKELTYCIAVSQDDIQDVTWRYSHSDNHRRVLSRRREVKEDWLVATIVRLRNQRQRSLTQERRSELEKRLVKELVEFLSPTRPEVKDSEKLGRESGGLAWRVSRGEVDLGQGQGMLKKPRVWLMTPADRMEYTLYYNCVRDTYMHHWGPFADTLKGRDGWAAGAWSLENMVRKEESDWKMVYLARRDANSRGKISWKFEIPDYASKPAHIQSVEIRMISAKFHESASIVLEISAKSAPDSPEVLFRIPETNCDKDGKWYWISSPGQFGPGTKCIRIDCILDGATSWQHAQLFRQKMDEVNGAPLLIKIRFEEDAN